MEAQTSVNQPTVRTLAGTFHERVREMDATLHRESPKYRAAVLLLSLTSFPAQIDHLSHWLAIPREFVARCLRRLVDNGVLGKEGLVGGWTGEVMVEEAFWADVNVANGSWLRRHDSRGSLEWIEAGGGWQKPYDYVANEVPESRTKYIAGEGSRPQLNIDCFAFTPQLSPSTWIGGSGDEYSTQGGSDFLGATTEDEFSQEDMESEPVEAGLAVSMAGAGLPEVIWLS